MNTRALSLIFAFILLTVWTPDAVFALAPGGRCGEALVGPTHVVAHGKIDSGARVDFQRTVKVLEWSYQTLFRKMKKPEFLAVVIDPKVDRRRFDAETWQVRRYPAAPDQILGEDAVDAHEIAHAIFTENMNEYSPEWRTWQLRHKLYLQTQFPLVEQLEKMSDGLWEKRSQLRDRLQRFPNGNPELEGEIQSVTAEMRRVYDELMNLPDIRILRPKIFDISSAYQEVISDLAGGLKMGFAAYADYLEAQILPSLAKYDFETRSLIVRLQRARAFTSKSDASLLRSQLAKIPKAHHDHLMLISAREFLYEKYLSNPKTIQNIDSFMAALFASTAREVVEKAKPQKMIDYTMVDDVNADLIQRWTEDLKEFE